MRDQLLRVLNNYKAYRNFNMEDVIKAEDYLDYHFPDWETNWSWVNDNNFKEYMLNSVIPF